MSLRIAVHTLSTQAGVLVRGLRLDIAPGTVHTLMGPSGSGKSSLLAAVCGTLPDGLQFAGTVHLGEERIDTQATQARRVGILFQDDLLFAHMTVGENLLFALPPGPRSTREALVAQVLRDVEMDGYAPANPATLSGGQRARAALARALLAQPRALLLDEPFAKLDAALKARMRALVFGLVKTRHIPALLVTHDPGDMANPHHCTQLVPH